MKTNKFHILIMALLISSCGSSSDNNYATSGSEAYGDLGDDSAQDESIVQADGDYDCTATNISRGNGPYTLGCEKDGSDVTIHFNNGGHITVDEDGYDSNTGENWDVELE